MSIKVIRACSCCASSTPGLCCGRVGFGTLYATWSGTTSIAFPPTIPLYEVAPGVWESDVYPSSIPNQNAGDNMFHCDGTCCGWITLVCGGQEDDQPPDDNWFTTQQGFIIDNVSAIADSCEPFLLNIRANILLYCGSTEEPGEASPFPCTSTIFGNASDPDYHDEVYVETIDLVVTT